MIHSIGHPGIFMKQTRARDLTNHVDASYVVNLMQPKPLDLGLLDLFALKQRVDVPLMTLNVENAKILYTPADFYTFELPTAADNTVRLISGGLEGVSKFGMDGEEFPIVISKKAFGPGAVITFDLTSKVSFTVVDRTPEPMGSHVKIWVRINTNSEVKFVTKADLQPQRQLIKLADVRGLDFNAFHPYWQVSGLPSVAKYKNYLSNTFIQQEYRITDGACHYLDSNNQVMDSKSLSMYKDVLLEFYAVKGIADNKFVDMNTPVNSSQYGKDLESAVTQGVGRKSFISFLDAVAVEMLMKQNYNLMLWGPGIGMLRDGYDTSRLIPGVWFQLDQSGYKSHYDIATFSLAVLADAIRDYEAGKKALKNRVETEVYKIRTGKGGKALIESQFLKDGFNVPAQVQNSDHKFLTGDANNLVFNIPNFKMFQVPELGYITVEYDPGLDPTLADDIVNPYVTTGRRLSSYTMIIEDYNESADNIIIIRKEGTGGRVIMNIESGGLYTHPIMEMGYNIQGQSVTVSNKSDNLTGFKANFTTMVDSAIVKDPTNLLKLVPKNPKTGRYAL